MASKIIQEVKTEKKVSSDKQLPKISMEYQINENEKENEKKKNLYFEEGREISFEKMIIAIDFVKNQLENFETNLNFSESLRENLLFLTIKHIIMRIIIMNSFNNEIPENEKINKIFSENKVVFKILWEKILFKIKNNNFDKIDKDFMANFSKNFNENLDFYLTLSEYLQFAIRELNHLIYRNIKEKKYKQENENEKDIVLLNVLVDYYEISKYFIEINQKIVPKNLDFSSMFYQKKPFTDSLYFMHLRRKIYHLHI